MKNKRYRIELGILLFAFSCFLLCFFHLEPDYFWHIKAGELVLQKGPLTHDVFSWVAPGAYWMSHEWLFEGVLAGLKVIFPESHPALYCFFCILGLCSLLFFPKQKETWKNIPYTFIFFLFFGILFYPYVQARPHMMSFPLLAFTIWVLTDAMKNPDSKKIYFLPVSTILWANVHGGSSNLSYLLCFVFFFAGCFSFQYKKIEAKRFSKKLLQQYFLVGILCMIATCMNPHGVQMFLYPYQNLLNSTMITNINEWQRTSLGNIYHFLFFGFLLFCLFTFLFSDKKIQWIDFILFGVVTFLGLKSIRFWIFGPIIMNYILFSYVKERKLDTGTDLVLIMISIFFLGTFFFHVGDIFHPKYSVYLTDDLIECLKEKKPQRLFNAYNYGGELIYHDIPVFIDGRADFYSNHNYQDYLDLTQDKNRDTLMLKYSFDGFLLNENSRLVKFLEESPEYEEIYHQKSIIYYQKKATN